MTTTTTETPTIESLAADLRITVKPAGPYDVAVFQDGVRVRTAVKHDTDEKTLGWALAGILHTRGRRQDWAFVMTVLRPGTSTDEWLALPEQLYSN